MANEFTDTNVTGDFDITGTMTASIISATTTNTGSAAATAAVHSIQGDDTYSRRLDFLNEDADVHWGVGVSGSVTGTANAGDDFTIKAFEDDATPIDTPITIVRAAGGAMTVVRPTTFSAASTFNAAVTVAADLTVSGGNELRVTDGADYVELDPDFGVDFYRSAAYISNTYVGGTLAVRISNATGYDRTAVTFGTSAQATFYSQVLAGLSGTRRGLMSLFRGTSTNSPAAIYLESCDGTGRYLFMDNAGTGLRLSSTLPTANTDGSAV